MPPRRRRHARCANEAKRVLGNANWRGQTALFGRISGRIGKMGPTCRNHRLKTSLSPPVAGSLKPPIAREEPVHGPHLAEIWTAVPREKSRCARPAKPRQPHGRWNGEPDRRADSQRVQEREDCLQVVKARCLPTNRFSGFAKNLVQSSSTQSMPPAR